MDSHSTSRQPNTAGEANVAAAERRGPTVRTRGHAAQPAACGLDDDHPGLLPTAHSKEDEAVHMERPE